MITAAFSTAFRILNTLFSMYYTSGPDEHILGNRYAGFRKGLFGLKKWAL
jgi:hypothetical protein